MTQDQPTIFEIMYEAKLKEESDYKRNRLIVCGFLSPDTHGPFEYVPLPRPPVPEVTMETCQDWRSYGDYVCWRSLCPDYDRCIHSSRNSGARRG